MKQNTRMPAFRDNLRELMGDLSVTDFAKKMGLSRQTVGFYLNGDRIPDCETLVQICQKCNVSANWLLGLPGPKDPNPEIAEIMQYTGLSEGSIKSIRFYAEDSGDALRGLDLLLNSLDFWGVCLTIERLRKSVEALSNDEYQMIDITTQQNLEKELIAAHPELNDKIQVLYGDLLLSAISKKATDFFNTAVNNVTGLSKRNLAPIGDYNVGDDNGNH